MAFAIDGLVSGLNTTNMISQLMQLEARPQSILKDKVSATQQLVTALQQLNTRVASLGSAADKMSAAGALDLYKASSSSDKVTATAGTGAATGSVDITVQQTAKSQISVSALVSDWPEEATMVTLALRDGWVEVDTTGKNLDEVAAAINAKDAGVTAMKVAAGTDGSGNPQYRLQFSATKTGSDGSFQIYQGNEAEAKAGSAPSLLAVQIRGAEDAEVTLWAGSPAAKTLTSSTNTFTALLPGVDVTVSGVSADPVTVSVARDQAGTTKMAKDLVDNLSGLFSYISTNTAVTTSTSSGTSTATGGIFTGDSSVRDVEQNILRAATAPVNGRSPSEIGISITKDGSVEFDADKFGKALADNPARAQQMLQEISSRVSTAAKDASDKYDGAITLRIQGQQSLVKDLNDQVSDWDRRLELRKSTLESTWAALEVQLSNLQSQGSWLTSQLGSLSTGTGSTK